MIRAILTHLSLWDAARPVLRDNPLTTPRRDRKIAFVLGENITGEATSCNQCLSVAEGNVYRQADIAVIGSETIRIVEEQGAEAVGPFLAGQR